MYEKFGIKKEIIELAEKVENKIQEQFKQINKIAEYNSLKVLRSIPRKQSIRHSFQFNYRIWV